MDQIPELATLTPKQRLRFLAQLYGNEVRTRAKHAMHVAEGEALAMQLAVELVDVGPDNLIWLGGKLEPLMVDIPTDDEEESEDAVPWPVNVEADLLARIRAAKVDLDEILTDHAWKLGELGGFVVATIGQVRAGDDFAVVTVTEASLGVESTYVFAMQRTV